MSNENLTFQVINDLDDPLHDIAANIEHVKKEADKKEADRRALLARRRIEALQDERQLAKRLVYFEYD